MLFAWWAFPAVTLTVFLLLSVLHFGDEDAPASASCRLMRIVAHGGAPIIVSAACHPEAVDRVFAALLPADAHAVTTLLSGPLMVLWVAAAAGALMVYAVSEQADNRAAGLDLILVALLFALAPPLIAFSLYFAAVHAPRAFVAAM